MLLNFSPKFMTPKISLYLTLSGYFALLLLLLICLPHSTHEYFFIIYIIMEENNYTENTEDEIKKSTAYQKVGMVSLLHHNERLARGLSTANILYADLSDNELDARIEALESEMEANRL